MITIIQILALIYVGFTASRAILRAKDNKISIVELFFWLSVWAGLTFVIFFPNITSLIANMVGIGRGIDFIIYISIATLFYLIFRLYVKIEDTQRQITLLVRQFAIEKKKRK
jgi:small membrane protein